MLTLSGFNKKLIYTILHATYNEFQQLKVDIQRQKLKKCMSFHIKWKKIKNSISLSLY